MFLARRITDAGAELLQTVVHQRYKLRRSIVVTSNRVVQDWGKYLGDDTMGTTILDRLMHRAALLEFEGKSYRLKEAAARIVQPAERLRLIRPHRSTASCAVEALPPPSTRPCTRSSGLRVRARRGQATCPQDEPVDSPCGVRGLPTAPRLLPSA